MKTYLCNIIFRDGTPSMKEEIEARNQRQARDFAERRYGGECTSANEVY